MAGGRSIGGGPPSTQDALRTMNQSIGQMMSFMQSKKQLDEMKREFDVDKGLAGFERMAIEAGGYAPLVKIMGGEEGVAEYFKNTGMDSLQANDFGKIMNKIKMTPQQITTETIKNAYAEGPESSNYQRLFFPKEGEAAFGGAMGAPDPRVSGLAEAGGKASSIAGDILEGFMGGVQGQGQVQGGTTPEDTGTTLAEDKAALEEAARLEAKANQNKPHTLIEPPDRIEGLRGEMADKVQERLDQKRKGELINALQQDNQTEGRDNPFVLHGQVSSGANSYTNKFTTKQNGVISSTLAEGIPTTQTEFNNINNPSRRDAANFALSNSLKEVSAPSEKANEILNRLDGTYTPSSMEGAQMLKNYEERMISYNAEAQNGNVPPLPRGIKEDNQALYVLAKAYVDDVPYTSIPAGIQRRAMRAVYNKATAQEVRDKLADDIDLIIQVSKNPALATYFMPEVEANRLENRQLSQADARILANKDITSTNVLLGVMNFLKGTMSTSTEGNEALLLAMKGGEKAYMEVLNTTKPGSDERAQAFLDTPIAGSYQSIAGTLLGEAAGRPAGMSEGNFGNGIQQVLNHLFGTTWGAEIETFQFNPIQPIQEPNTTVEDASKFDLLQ